MIKKCEVCKSEFKTYVEHLKINGSLVEKRWAKYRRAVMPNVLIR